MSTRNHAGLTADMFVLRDGGFLTLKRGPGLGEGLYYLPGGIVEPGEDPLDAAVRETEEESGLRVRDAKILRVWTYPTPEGHETVHATFVGWSGAGEVCLSSEHTKYRWTRVGDYVERFCHEGMEQSFPQAAVWFRQVRTNCGLVQALLDANVVRVPTATATHVGDPKNRAQGDLVSAILVQQQHVNGGGRTWCGWSTRVQTERRSSSSGSTTRTRIVSGHSTVSTSPTP